MTNPFTALDGLLSGAVNAVFGELFEFRAYAAGADVNAPPSADATRPTFRALATFAKQTNSKTPTARGAVQDDNAHGWTVSIPMLFVDDPLLQWPVRTGDRVVEVVEAATDTTPAVYGDVYQITVPPRPDGMGHTCIQLSNRRRTA